jgi:catechol 2,3-dioxygenase-like lactoylglutathione lyase family enzyme
VRDAEAAMKSWAALGVGPFHVARDVVPDNYRYRGQSAEAPRLTLCFGQAGPLQIEIIEQHNDAPSAYTEFLAAGREGAQHVALWFDDRAQYEAAHSRILAAGLTLVHENGLASPGPRFAYFATALPGGLMVEIAEALLPEVRPLFDLVASSSVGWDGSDPIRYL